MLMVGDALGSRGLSILDAGPDVHYEPGREGGQVLCLNSVKSLIDS